MLEERGFKGRFATLMVALVNIRTGVCVMVNAGDNIVHIYSAREKRMVLKKHPNPPAAGVFPSVLLETKSGYVPTTEKLEPGDTLFLMTDGIEEAQRLFRDTEFRQFELEQDEQVEEDGRESHPAKGQPGSSSSASPARIASSPRSSAAAPTSCGGSTTRRRTRSTSSTSRPAAAASRRRCSP